jgi:hypothetical protein
MYVQIITTEQKRICENYIHKGYALGNYTASIEYYDKVFAIDTLLP